MPTATLIALRPPGSSYCTQILVLLTREARRTESAMHLPCESPFVSIRSILFAQRTIDYSLRERLVERLTRKETPIQDGTENRGDQLTGVL